MCRLQVDQSRVREVVLVREDRACPQCGARMHIRCSRQRSIHTLAGAPAAHSQVAAVSS